MALIEVRCCCQPTKLLGWMEIGDMPTHNGLIVNFAISPMQAPLQIVRLPVAEFFQRGLSPIPDQTDAYDLIDDRHLALKSEETPIEVLRSVPQFIENTTKVAT